MVAVILLTNVRHVNALTGVDFLHLTALCPNRDCVFPADSAGGIVDCKVKFWRRSRSLQNRRYFFVFFRHEASTECESRKKGARKRGEKKEKNFAPLPSRVTRAPRSPRACLRSTEKRPKKIAPVLQASKAVKTSGLPCSTAFGQVLFEGTGDGRGGKTASSPVPLSRKLYFFREKYLAPPMLAGTLPSEYGIDECISRSHL